MITGAGPSHRGGESVISYQLSVEPLRQVPMANSLQPYRSLITDYWLLITGSRQPVPLGLNL